jgi:nucleoside phosphorylase
MSEFEELDYKDEDQSWYAPDLPETQEITQERLEQIQEEIDVVIITATDTELKAVSHLLKPYPESQKVLQVFRNSNQKTYYLGEFGKFKTVVTMCDIGAKSATLITEQALNLWKPNVIIMVGIAFGRDQTKQKIADVLVAKEIICYDEVRQEKGETKPLVQSIYQSSSTLIKFFETYCNDWKFNSPIYNSRPTVQFTQIISGNSLVNDQDFRDNLFRQYPYALGGEMEGAGFYYAARENKDKRCILVKSICDWADGTKNDRHQPLAAAAAASLVHHVLSQKAVVDEFCKKNILGIRYIQAANSDNDELLQILKSESDEIQKIILNQYHKYLDSKSWTGEKANNLQQMLTELTTKENKAALAEFLQSLINTGKLSRSGSDKLLEKYQLSQQSPQPEVQPYLLVQFKPCQPDDKNFLIKAWLVCDGKLIEKDKRITLLYPIAPIDEEKKYSLPELKIEAGIVSKIIIDSLDILCDQGISTTLKIEFFLPIKYININIHQWEISNGLTNDIIGIHYPVVVRLYERLLERHRRFTTPWRKKWDRVQQIQNSQFSDLFVILSQTDNFDNYLQRQLADVNKIGLKLSCADFGKDSKLLEKLISRFWTSGTPIAIFPTDDSAAQEIDSLLMNANQKEIHYLPNCLHEKRLAEWDIGQNLVLLWEDPNRLTPDVEYTFESPTEYQN